MKRRRFFDSLLIVCQDKYNNNVQQDEQSALQIWIESESVPKQQWPILQYNPAKDCQWEHGKMRINAIAVQEGTGITGQYSLVFEWNKMKKRLPFVFSDGTSVFYICDMLDTLIQQEQAKLQQQIHQVQEELQSIREKLEEMQRDIDAKSAVHHGKHTALEQAKKQAQSAKLSNFAAAEQLDKQLKQVKQEVDTIRNSSNTATTTTTTLRQVTQPATEDVILRQALQERGQVGDQSGVIGVLCELCHTSDDRLDNLLSGMLGPRMLLLLCKDDATATKYKELYDQANKRGFILPITNMHHKVLVAEDGTHKYRPSLFASWKQQFLGLVDYAANLIQIRNAMYETEIRRALFAMIGEVILIMYINGICRRWCLTRLQRQANLERPWWHRI